VPGIAEAAVIVLRERPSGTPDASWLHVDADGVVRAEPIAGGRRTALEAAVSRALASGQPETMSAPLPDLAHGLVLPLVTQRWTFGALAVLAPGAAAYAEADRTLVHDVANRAAIALENSRLYEEIRARDRQKDEFLAMLSHELRNPLGAITTAVGLLDLVGQGDARAVRAREVIARQSAHLTRMIDDLLDVARLTAGRITAPSRRCARRGGSIGTP
jgi:signal transduction histidine kinase